MLMIHDTTGTQTDCPKSLSRKKLKQLMPLNHGLTAKALYRGFGRMSPAMKRELRAAEAAAKAEARGEEIEIPIPKVAHTTPKPNLFNRLGAKLANLRKQAERKIAKGK